MKNIIACYNLMLNMSPHCGYKKLFYKYIDWSGVGFVGVFIASELDKITGGTYYTRGINQAVAGEYWNLVGILGLLLCWLSIAVLYISYRTSHRFIALSKFSTFTRKKARTVSMVAVDLGALSLGILLSSLFIDISNTYLLTWQIVLFGIVSIPLLILSFIFLNSFLWWISESIYDEKTGECSDFCNQVMQLPSLFTAVLFWLMILVLIVFSIFYSR